MSAVPGETDCIPLFHRERLLFGRGLLNDEKVSPSPNRHPHLLTRFIHRN